MTPARITIREVGPRDGLQAEAPLHADDRVRLIGALQAAGVSVIEAGAFVSPAAVPAMAGSGEVLAAIDRPSTMVWALVPNARGAQLAVAAGVDGITVTVSASPAYNEKNVHRTVDESVAEMAAIREASGERLPLDAVVSCAFGCPYEGEVEPATVAALAARLRSAGATAVTLADTTGMATPPRIATLLDVVAGEAGLHLHDTRGTALVNAYAALQLGVVRFDTSIGGLGGSPFAPGATGNLATEELVYLCDELGIETGIDLTRLLGASSLVRELVGHPLASRVATAGQRLASATG